MVDPEVKSAKHWDRTVVSGLWIAAGAVVIIGSLLRPLARFLGGPDLRMVAVVMIAAGLGVAALAWIGEKLINGRDSG
jgi:Flp pilus assembly protein protease CpaA